MYTPGPSPSPIGSGLDRLLNSVARVRPAERRAAGGAFLLLFGFMTGHAMLETARDTLFLSRFPARQLPWVYLAIAMSALLFMGRSGQLRPRRRQELGGWLVTAAIGTFLFYIGIRWSVPWIVYLLYVWSGLLATVVLVRFWTVLGSTFAMPQAKRLYPVIAAGSVLGAIAGSAMARAIAEVLPPDALVLAASFAFLAAAPAAALLGAPAAVPELAPGAGAAARTALVVWRHPYLRRLAALILIGSVAFTLVDFTFKSAVARFVLVEDMGEFLASVYLTVNVLSLVIQVFAVAGLVRLVGVHAAVTLVPVLILLAAGGAVIWPGISSLLLLKMTDGALRHSVHRTGSELLFVPLPGKLRGPAKAIIDVLGQRGGQALGSLLILAVLTITTKESTVIVAAGICATIWVLMAATIRQPYLDQFREALHSAAAINSPVETLEGSALESALAALESDDELRVLTALDLLAEAGNLDAVPPRILSHPSSVVTRRALELFHQNGLSEDALPIIAGLTDHPDSATRAAALRALSTLTASDEWVVEALADPDPTIRVTAILTRSHLEQSEVPELAALVDANDFRTLEAAADTVRVHPSPSFIPLVMELLHIDHPAVRAASVRAAAAIGEEALIDDLVPLLASRGARHEVRRALLALGQPALKAMASALADPSQPHEVRRQLPSSIAAFSTPGAAAGLLRHLVRESDGLIRYKILLALGQWRDDWPSGTLDIERVREARHETLHAALRFGRWRAALATGDWVASPWRQALVMLLRDKQVHSLERLLLLLHLETGNDDFQSIARGFAAGNLEALAGGRELLEHLAPVAERRDLLRLADEIHDPDLLQGLPDDEEEGGALLELIGSESESLSALASREAAHLGMRAAVPVLLERLSTPPEYHRAVQRALDLLGASGASDAH